MKIADGSVPEIGISMPNHKLPPCKPSNEQSPGSKE